MSPEPSPAEVHRRIVEEYLGGPLDADRIERGLAYVDEQVIDHRGGADGDHVGREEWRRKWQRAAEGGDFRDVSMTIEQNVSAGDTSVNRYTSRATHTATGRGYAVTSMDMVRVRDGRIVEHWALRDRSAIEHQLGL